MEAAYVFGEGGRHREYLELGQAFFSRDRDGVGGNDFEHVLPLVQAIERAGGEQAVGAGDARRAGVALAQPFEQLDHRAASGDLVIEHNDVAASDITYDRADLDVVVAEAPL